MKKFKNILGMSILICLILAIFIIPGAISGNWFAVLLSLGIIVGMILIIGLALWLMMSD